MPTHGDGLLGQRGRRAASTLRPGPVVHAFGPRLRFDIDQYRAEQIAPLAQFRPYLMGANILAVLVILWFGTGFVSDTWLTAWTLAQAVLTAAVLRP